MANNNIKIGSCGRNLERPKFRCRLIKAAAAVADDDDNDDDDDIFLYSQ